jgi:hypothetical protein
LPNLLLQCLLQLVHRAFYGHPASGHFVRIKNLMADLFERLAAVN